VAPSSLAVISSPLLAGAMAADAGALAHAVDRVSSLPAALVHNVFSRLTADERARCATVCRSWCTLVSERSLWLCLDLSVSSGVTCIFNDAALVAAAARAGGQLEALDLTGRNVSFAALLTLVTANSATLRELRSGDARVQYQRSCAEIESLLRAAPHLRVLETHASVEATVAGRMLRNEPPFGPLRLTQLYLNADAELTDEGVLSVTAGMVEHAAPLVELAMHSAVFHDAAVLDAVVNAVLARRVRCLIMDGEWMTPASVPALVRLLDGDALEELGLGGQFPGADAFDEPTAALLGAALAANTTLTSLTLDAPAAVMRALTAHPSLRKMELTIGGFDDDDANEAAFEAVGALVAANAPPLRELRVHNTFGKGGVALRPLFNALPANTHLRSLDCSLSSMPAAFARDRLLPALRANTGLRRLRAMSLWFSAHDNSSAADRELTRELQAEAEALVAARGGNGDA
jgi:hypothetical protein